MFFCKRRDPLHQGCGVHDAIDVIQGKFNLGARLLSARLLRGASGKDAYNARAPVGKDNFDGAAESGSIGQQKDHGGDAPSHAQHGECGAAAIVPHGAVSLRQ